MKSSEYFKKRFKALEERANEEALKCTAKSQGLIQDAITKIDKDITYWIKRFAVNNNITLAQARKTITNKELEELGWDVFSYIKKGIDNSFSGEWTTELENASANYHISRLEAIKLQMQSISDTAFKEVTGVLTDSLKKVYEDTYYRTAFEVQKEMGIGFSFEKVDEKKLKMLLEKPWAADGLDFSKRIWGSYRPKLVNKLQKTLTDWCIKGTSPEALAMEISRESGVAKGAAKRLIQTETAQICSRAEKDSYEELGIEKYKILAALDGKTCEICGDMDGRIFAKEDFQTGVTAPPFHPGCRCTTVPYFDDDFDIGERAARDENGKTYYIPDDMNYQQWKETFVNGKTQTKNNVQEVEKEVAKDEESGIIKTGSKDISRYLGKPILETDNQHIREWYVANVSDIPNQIDKSKSFEEQVKQAYNLRNKYKREARVAMSDIKAADELNERYPAKSFDELLTDKMSRKGFTKDEALEDILKTAATTNENVNKEFGL